ncbi:MAG: hypothetical protein JSU69_11145 [Candidatus Zixiibacteriota bacterium]|nr:MAG: hypothetical protein JSU69_11145 [candidate division Zixibacteria bacterium]
MERVEKKDRKELAEEWQKIMKYHPLFARSFLAQQAILMEVSQLGLVPVVKSMCDLLNSGLPVLFEDYWATKCKKVNKIVEVGGVLGCLSNTSRDPAECFGSDDPEGFFEDPLAEGHVLPPKPPDPHIR